MDALAYGAGGGGGIVNDSTLAGAGKSGVVVIYEYGQAAGSAQGTTNNLAKFNEDGTLVDSDIVEASGAVGIGDNSPATWKLRVHGDGGAPGHVAAFSSTESVSYVSIAAGSKQHYLYTKNDGTFGVHEPGVADKLTIYADGTTHLKGGVVVTSDAMLKKDIETLSDPMEKLRRLRGVSYHWEATNRDPTRQLGVIAQEVEKVYPELIRTDPETGLKAVKMGQLTGLFIEAFKEQQDLLEHQHEKIQSLEARLSALET